MSMQSDPMSSDRWRSVDAHLDDAVAYLEVVTHLIQDSKRRVTEMLRLAPGQHALEIGCGIGHDTEAMARAVAPGGHVVGVDLSAELIAKAIARNASLGPGLEFRVADALDLPFPENSFDAVRVERVLQHLPDVTRALREIVRVTKPGGIVVTLDPDRETITASGGEVATLRAVKRFYADQAVTHGGLGRDTPILLHEAGCTDIKVESVTVQLPSLRLLDTVMGLRNSIEGAVARGWITEADGHAWWTEAERRDAVGAFYGVFVGQIVAGTVA